MSCMAIRPPRNVRLALITRALLIEVHCPFSKTINAMNRLSSRHLSLQPIPRINIYREHPSTSTTPWISPAMRAAHHHWSGVAGRLHLANSQSHPYCQQAIFKAAATSNCRLSARARFRKMTGLVRPCLASFRQQIRPGKNQCKAEMETSHNGTHRIGCEGFLGEPMNGG
jgi:hypothetical protein